ncbi:MAG: glycerophosphodiester phosphodiesterase [Planctomycetes bacterium]|nr:glycerophosphodiester phosphodiesterase [Planctomycetota bacterium]
MTNPYLRGQARPTRVANVGHRGAMGLRPENTLEGFELAFDLGADMVELDVHPSRDGHPVVLHDDRLGRTTDAGRRRPGGGAAFVSDLTLDELRALDAGTWFVEALERGAPPAPHGPTDDERRAWLTPGALAALGGGRVRPPSLEEVLLLARRRGRRVNVELKLVPRRYERLVAAVVEVVRRLGVEEQVLLSSFDHAGLAEAKRLAPELPVAALCVARLADPGRYVAEVLGGDAWNPGCVGEVDTLGFGAEAFARDGARALDRASVEGARARGVSVHTWTVNDPARLEALVALGVDAIITDYPNRLSRVIAPATSV